ncbi:MAG: RNA polymerase sigma factor [Pirellulaceae bacterium]|nr:RNA polymerase sigma factor [Pirellulaceae bacterium]
MLLAQVQQMDSQGWDRLVQIFGPIIYRWCRTAGIDNSDAPDIVQEVFASLVRGIPDFRRLKEAGSFRCWLATITRNCIRDHFRKQTLEQATGGTAGLTRLQQQVELHESTTFTDNIRSPALRRVLDGVQAEFEVLTWDAFWMTVVDGCPALEVADLTGMSPASVYQAKSRVLRRLRQRLKVDSE